MQSKLVDNINFMLRFKNKSWAIRNILKLQPTTEWQLHETDPEQWKILSHKLASKLVGYVVFILEEALY